MFVSEIHVGRTRNKVFDYQIQNSSNSFISKLEGGCESVDDGDSISEQAKLVVLRAYRHSRSLMMEIVATRAGGVAAYSLEEL